MSSNETNAVKANFEYMMVKVNGSYDSSTDRTFSNSEETEWSIHVEFASLEELAEHKTSRRNDDERVIDWIFTLDQLPSDMVFPLGRPKPGLYMAHPVLTDHYYPMEIAEEKLFMEKVIEFCWLVQCLGATEVSFHSDKGLSVSQGMESSRTIKADVGVKKVGVGGEYGNTQSSDEDNVIGQKVELIQRFAPQHQAYCPAAEFYLLQSTIFLNQGIYPRSSTS